ncbi:hypothetical protein Sjap_009679 [Stephania japonica]|uniref:Uncharacterized protein n=1 Tax=Stephania japonica TaxID=461633 RepID=A0AAP0J7J2_9MAGN
MAAEDPIFVWSSSSSDGNPESPTFYLLSNPSDYFRDDDLDNFFQNDAGHDHKHGLLTACSDQWTRNDNKLFESAIAELGSDTPNLFAAIAAKVPGKTFVLGGLRQIWERRLEEHFKELCDHKDTNPSCKSCSEVLSPHGD